MMLLPMLKGGNVANEWQPMSALICSGPVSFCKSFMAEKNGRSGQPVHSPEGRGGTSVASFCAGTSGTSFIRAALAPREGAPAEVGSVPAHVAIIMDGNGRWAGRRSLKCFLGHQQGARSVQLVTETASRIGLPWLTLYAFSLENSLRRPRALLVVHLCKRESRADGDQIQDRMRGIGRQAQTVQPLPSANAYIRWIRVRALLGQLLAPPFRSLTFFLSKALGGRLDDLVCGREYQFVHAGCKPGHRIHQCIVELIECIELRKSHRE